MKLTFEFNAESMDFRDIRDMLQNIEEAIAVLKQTKKVEGVTIKSNTGNYNGFLAK